MTHSPGNTSRLSWVAWPAEHPLPTFLIAILLAAVSVLVVTRMRRDAALSSMLSQHEPSTAALERVTADFDAIDGLSLMASLPADAQTPARQIAPLLLDFADRLAADIRRDPLLAAVVEHIEYETPSQAEEFAANVVAPNLPYYLDDPGLALLRQRLSPDGMAAQISRNESLLAAPGAAAPLARALLKDPLRLHDLVLPRFLALQSGSSSFAAPTAAGPRPFISADGRTILLRLWGQGSVADSAFVRRFMSAVRSAADRANTARLSLEYTGGFAIAELAERSIRHDMIWSITTSLLSMQLLFWLAYRGPFTFLLAMAPVAWGVLVSFGIYGLFAPSVTPLVAVIGAVLAGVGIDYSIHYLSHAHAAAPKRSAALLPNLLLPLLAAFATSAISFLVIALSDVQAIRGFSILAVLALSATFLASLTLLPAILRLVEPSSPSTSGGPGGSGGSGGLPRCSLLPVITVIARRPRLFLALGLTALAGVLAALLFTGPRGLQLEHDLRAMHPRPNPPLDAQQRLTERFGLPSDYLVVYLDAPDPQSLLALAHRADRALRTAPATAAVACVLGISTLLPDPAAAPACQQALAAIDERQVVADFRAAVQHSAFAPAAYRDYEQYLQSLLRPSAHPGIESLLAYPAIVHSFLPRQAFLPGAAPPTQAITLIALNRPLDDQSQRRATLTTIRDLLAPLPGPHEQATLTGMNVIAADIENVVHRDLGRFIATASAGVLLYLLLTYRRVLPVLLASLPAVAAAFCMLAAMSLLDLRFNLVNLIAIPLLAGIGVDYGIFFVSAAQQARRAQSPRQALIDSLSRSAYAVALCCLTTVLGFGSLVTTSTPAIASLGLLLSIGVLASAAWTLLLVAPLLFLSCESTHRSRKAPDPS